MSDQPHLDWSAAQVSGGTLTVPVTGESDDEWEQTFVRTLALLAGSGTWGSVGFTEETVTVEGVQEGSEGNVRFALDGAVQEANAHHADPADDASEESSDGGDDAEGDDTDQRMTDRFRDASD